MKIYLSLLLFLPAIAFSQPSQLMEVDEQMKDDFEWIDELYVDLHQNPELSFREVETSKKMANLLRKSGYEVTESFGGHGVVGVLKNGEGPTVLLRADMDALPIVEETGLDIASTKTDTLNGNTVGIMHACGHDIHMTVLAGTSHLLAEMKNKWKGTLICIFQPAEERGGGAKAMLSEGLYSKFGVPDYALALHTSTSEPAGTIAICSGNALASVDMVDITVYGKGGHGAYPHKTIDPVVLSSRIVLDLQTLVSREISPFEPAVVTVGSIHGGSKGNIIPNEVKLELTLRSYSEEVRDQTIEGIKRITKSLAISAGLPEALAPIVSVRNESIPATFNDPELSNRLLEVLQKEMGDDKAFKTSAVMAGEDFGLFGKTDEKVPIMIYWLGTVEQSLFDRSLKGEVKIPSLHSSTYVPDAPTSIRTGIQSMSLSVLHLMNN